MKTLIVYSSSYGFTQCCAKRIGENLIEGADVIRLNPLFMPDVNPYDQIIIGTPVYMGKINSWIRMFCENKLETLLKKEVSIFVCCSRLEQVNEVIGTSFPRQLIVAAKSIEVLGGEVVYSQLKWYHKAIVNMAGESLFREQDPPEGPGLLYQNHRRMLRHLNG